MVCEYWLFPGQLRCTIQASVMFIYSRCFKYEATALNIKVLESKLFGEVSSGLTYALLSGTRVPAQLGTSFLASPKDHTVLDAKVLVVLPKCLQGIWTRLD